MSNTTLYFDEKLLETKKTKIGYTKSNIISFWINNTLNKCLSMFEWKGLPTTIPQRALELTMLRGGSTNIFKFNGKLYQSYGYISGRLNWNYMPQMTIVTNPYIKDFGSKTMKVYYGKDDAEPVAELKYDMECVYAPNDPLYTGVLPILQYYAEELAENRISKRLVTVNARAMNLFVAPDENARQSFESFISKLEDGELKAILARNILKDVQSLPYSQNNSMHVLTDLIEDQQYIKASLLNELGLNANYNMKRESINSNESQLNEDALLPFSDQMLKMRKETCRLVKELFNENWDVDFSSAWKEKRVEIDEMVDAIDGRDDKSNELDKTEIEEEKEDE